MKKLNYFAIENRVFQMARKNKDFSESILKEILYLIVERLAVQQELDQLHHHIVSRRLAERKDKTRYDEALRTVEVLEFELQDLQSGIQELRYLRKEAKRIYRNEVM